MDVANNSFISSYRPEGYCINISQHYCSHWQALHALRQALQNWQDVVRKKYHGSKIEIKQFTKMVALGIYRYHFMINNVKSQVNYIEYDKNEQKLTLINQDSFQVHNMLMGSSSKMNDQITLGQFGQGMKLYFKILIKFGYNLYIKSGDYVYCPQLKQWQYEYNSRVLYVKIKQRQDKKNNTQLYIYNIPFDLFQNFLYLSLSLVTDYTFIAYPKMRLIISKNPLLRGKIFKKGILVAMRYNLDSIYSYDFDDIELGRQRDSVNDPLQLKILMSVIHVRILNDNNIHQSNAQLINELPNHFQQFIKMMKRCSNTIFYALNNLQSYPKYNPEKIKVQQQTYRKIYIYFLKQNKTAQLYPINSSYDSNEVYQSLTTFGLDKSFYPIIHIGWQYYAVLRKYNNIQGCFRTIRNKIDTVLANKRLLTQQQLNLFNPIKDKIAVQNPQINTYNFMVNQYQNITCYRSEDKKTIIMNMSELTKDKQKFKRKLQKLILFDV